MIKLDRLIAIGPSTLPGGIQGDPSDRTITANARVHGACLLTVDRKLLAYPHVGTL